MTTFTANEIHHLSIHALARMIRQDWKNVYFGAVPYLAAMDTMQEITDPYGMDDGTEIVRYFLSNASGWRGETARMIKKELNARLK